MQLSRESTVLIVDDEPEIRRLASAQLQEAGYATVEAATAEQALVLMDEREPDRRRSV
jgi:CheY-like chemotaxis protein